MMPARPQRGSVPDQVYSAFVPRRSRLRRTSDRWETASRWIALAVFLLLVPLVLQLGDARTQQLRDQAALERATDHQVHGTVVGVTAARGEGSAPVLSVSWTEPGGSVHLVSLTAYDDPPPGLGAPYPLWVTPGLEAASPPPTEQDAVLEGDVADIGGFTGTLVLLLSAQGLVQWRLDRRRLRQWDEDWLAFRCGRDHGAAG